MRINNYRMDGWSMAVKSNNKVTIRSVRLEDATAVLDLQREIVSEGDFFIADAQEYKKTLEQQLQFS